MDFERYNQIIWEKCKLAVMCEWLGSDNVTVGVKERSRGVDIICFLSQSTHCVQHSMYSTLPEERFAYSSCYISLSFPPIWGHKLAHQSYCSKFIGKYLG